MRTDAGLPQPSAQRGTGRTLTVNGIDGYRYLRALFIALPNAKTADDYAALLQLVARFGDAKVAWSLCGVKDA